MSAGASDQATRGKADELRVLFDAALEACLATRYPADNAVDDAARYALTGGGKRVRPMLCLLAADAVGGTARAALPAALAVELVHTYSLIHDDLPCMDDDDLRRGRPTVHKMFGEANALLAGDALLTDAFALLSGPVAGHGDETAVGNAAGLTKDLGADGRATRPGPDLFASATHLPPATRLALIAELALAAGGAGMVLGQSRDLHWTGRGGATRTDLDDLHLRKTGYLLGAAAAMGGLAGGAPDATASALRRAGRHAGLAFQILDDLLDDEPGTGKSRGKDKDAGKLTYLSLMSPAAARSAASEATAAARLALTDLGPGGAALRAYIDALLIRTA